MIRRIVILVLSVLVGLGTSSAAAQQGSHFTFHEANLSSFRLSVVRTGLDSGKQSQEVDSIAPNLPSPGAAERRSLLYTLVPLPTLILTVPALIAGPSAGYFYAGMNGRAWAGMGIRTLALGGMFSAFAICGWDCGPGESAYSIAWAVFIGSGAILAGSAIYDIATVKGATRQRNERQGVVVVTMYPGYFPRLKAFGLTLAHRF